MVEAEFGLMHITGERSGPPVKVGVAVTDLTTGLYTSNAILAALLGRAKTNLGQHLDVALSDCQVATLSNIASSVLISGERDTGRWGTAHPSIAPYKGFKTRDGDIMLGGGNDRLFGVICDRLDQPAWKTNPKFTTNNLRVTNRVELEAAIESVTSTKTTAEWLELLEGSGMPYAAINDVKDTLEHEHTVARGMVVEVEHEGCGPVKLVGPPVKYSEEGQTSVRMAPPMLGQHSEEVLREVLEMGEGEIQGLMERGVVS
jgi:succinate--hydroxymethylglutarate CoA-transferase